MIISVRTCMMWHEFSAIFTKLHRISPMTTTGLLTKCSVYLTLQVCSSYFWQLHKKLAISTFLDNFWVDFGWVHEFTTMPCHVTRENTSSSGTSSSSTPSSLRRWRGTQQKSVREFKFVPPLGEYLGNKLLGYSSKWVPTCSLWIMYLFLRNIIASYVINLVCSFFIMLPL